MKSHLDLKTQTFDGKPLEIGNPDQIKAMKLELSDKKRRKIQVYYLYQAGRFDYNDHFDFCVSWNAGNDCIQRKAEEKIKNYKKFNKITRQSRLIFPDVKNWGWRDVTTFKKKRRMERV